MELLAKSVSTCVGNHILSGSMVGIGDPGMVGGVDCVYLCGVGLLQYRVFDVGYESIGNDCG